MAGNHGATDFLCADFDISVTFIVLAYRYLQLFISINKRHLGSTGFGIYIAIFVIPDFAVIYCTVV